MIFLIDGQILETDEIDRPISTYFKNVLYNLIAGTAGNIWYIAVSSAQSVAKLDPWLVGRLNVLEDSCFAPSTDYSRADAYTDRINEIVAEHNVDVFWSPNPLMVDVLCPNKKINCQHFATVYDMLSYTRPLKEWSRESQSEYDRRIDYLKNVHLLCISSSAQSGVLDMIENTASTTTVSLSDSKFTWSKTAEQTFMAMKNSCRRPAAAKKRIAVVSSWPNQQTGIANFIYRLMPYLAEHFDVDIFIDNSVVSDVEFVPYDYGSLYFINELEKRHLEYDKIIYHIGNNASFHKGTYLMMRKYPGTAEIHDFNLNGLFHSFFEGDKPALLQAFVDGYGAEGEREFAAIINGGGYINSLPMSHSVAAISDMAIVHNEWSWHALKSRKAALVPLPCPAWQPPEPKEVAFSKVQEIIRKRQGELVIAVFGYMGNNRRLSVVLGAFWRLSQKYAHIKLAFFGTCHDESALRFVSEHNLGGRFFITGYLEPSEYDCALALTDICVNLRYPSMGESSASLAEELKAGKPVIVSELNQYTEFPDEVCWKVPVDGYEEPILRKMLEHLITHEETRQQLGANAKRYADTVLTCENIAEMYARVL